MLVGQEDIYVMVKILIIDVAFFVKISLFLIVCGLLFWTDERKTKVVEGSRPFKIKCGTDTDHIKTMSLKIYMLGVLSHIP